MVVIEKFAAPAGWISSPSGRCPARGRCVGCARNCARRVCRKWGIIAQIDTLSARFWDLPATMKEADVVLLSREGARDGGGAREDVRGAEARAAHVREDRKTVRGDAADGFDDLRAQAHASGGDGHREHRARRRGRAVAGTGDDGGALPAELPGDEAAIAREADSVYDYESRYRRQMQQINVKLAKATDSVPWGEKGEAEKHGDRRRLAALAARLEHFEPNVNLRKEALAAAAVQTAFQVDASLIVVFSHTGETTRLVAEVSSAVSGPVALHPRGARRHG